MRRAQRVRGFGLGLLLALGGCGENGNGRHATSPPGGAESPVELVQRIEELRQSGDHAALLRLVTPRDRRLFTFAFVRVLGDLARSRTEDPAELADFARRLEEVAVRHRVPPPEPADVERLAHGSSADLRDLADRTLAEVDCPELFADLMAVFTAKGYRPDELPLFAGEPGSEGVVVDGDRGTVRVGDGQWSFERCDGRWYLVVPGLETGDDPERGNAPTAH